jgi:hypothetical protein
MPRIDIELTSSRPDGTWTWRAAGARQPKGVVAGSVLHEGAKVGDVLKAEADFDLDGINVTSVTPPKAKTRKADADVLPILGSGKEEALVTHSPLKPEREGGDRGRRGDRGDRGDRFGGGAFGSGRPGGPGGAGGPGGRPGGPGSTRPRATPGPGGGPRDGARRDGGGPTGPGERERVRPDRPERPRGERVAGDRPGGDRPRREGPGREGPGRERGDGGRPPREGSGRERPARAPAGPARPKPAVKRLQPGRAHREAVLAALPPEQRAIAEQVLRGGLAGVRNAVEEQNAQARAAGGPEIRPEALLTLAEELLPSLRAAEWRDRAEAAAAAIDEVGLRDLRTVVAGADAAGRDEESRALVTQLREGLERRSAAERQTWVDEISTCLTEGRVVRALRVSSRAPEQGLRLPAEVSTGLGTAVGDAMSSDTAPDRWLALLEAVLTSPVRRSIVPKGLPAGADEATLKIIRQAIPKVPALGPLLGESPTARPVPPPPPRRPPAPPAAARPAAPPAPVSGQAVVDTGVVAAPVPEPEAAPVPEPQPAVEPEVATVEPQQQATVEREADPVSEPVAVPEPQLAVEPEVAAVELQQDAQPQAVVEPEATALPEPVAAAEPEVAAAEPEVAAVEPDAPQGAADQP